MSSTWKEAFRLCTHVLKIAREAVDVRAHFRHIEHEPRSSSNSIKR